MGLGANRRGKPAWRDSIKRARPVKIAKLFLLFSLVFHVEQLYSGSTMKPTKSKPKSDYITITLRPGERERLEAYQRKLAERVQVEIPLAIVAGALMKEMLEEKEKAYALARG